MNAHQFEFRTIKGEALPKTIDSGFAWYDSTNIDAPEIARDLQKMDVDAAAFETDYKGKLGEFTAREDGGRWLAEAVKRYEAIDDLAGRLGSYAGLVHAGDR